MSSIILKRAADAIAVLIGVKIANDTMERGIAGASTTFGADFGSTITNTDLLFAVKREPIAYRIVFMVAHDVFDKWFSVIDTGESPDDNLDAAVQLALTDLNAQHVLTDMAINERLYGWVVIVKGYGDGDDLFTEPGGKAPLNELAIYAPTLIPAIQDVVDIDDPRFGQPELYTLQRGSSQSRVHYTRAIHVSTRLLDHTYKGISALEPVWDDLTCLRNIRWGMAQTMFRYGSGFPDITIKGANKAQLEDFVAGGVFQNVHARTYFVHNENQSMEFKGTEGSALNPQGYYEPILENIAAGCGIPKAILRGAQAGALTGSEVNLSEYFKLIADCQSRYESSIRELIDDLIERGQIRTSAKQYEIEWLSGFQHSDEEEARISLTNEQSQTQRASYMTINEIRASAVPPLDPISTERGGDIIPGIEAMLNPPEPPQTMTPEELAAQLKNKNGQPNGEEPDKTADSNEAPVRHPSLVDGLKAIINRCVVKDVERKQAIEEADILIRAYTANEASRAVAYVRARTGNRALSITPEMQNQYDAISKQYVEDFTIMLDDSLKNGGVVE